MLYNFNLFSRHFDRFWLALDFIDVKEVAVLKEMLLPNFAYQIFILPLLNFDLMNLEQFLFFSFKWFQFFREYLIGTSAS